MWFFLPRDARNQERFDTFGSFDMWFNSHCRQSLFHVSVHSSIDDPEIAIILVLTVHSSKPSVLKSVTISSAQVPYNMATLLHLDQVWFPLEEEAAFFQDDNGQLKEVMLAIRLLRWGLCLAIWCFLYATVVLHHTLTMIAVTRFQRKLSAWRRWILYWSASSSSTVIFSESWHME